MEWLALADHLNHELNKPTSPSQTATIIGATGKPLPTDVDVFT